MKALCSVSIPGHSTISWNKLYAQKHWRTRQRMAKEIHNLVGFTISGIHIRIPYKVDIKLTAYYQTKRRHDSDNICAKLYIDGLKGILPEDDSRWVGQVTTQALVDQKENKLLIEIFPANGKV